MAKGGVKKGRGNLWLTAIMISVIFAVGVKLLFFAVRMMEENATYGIAPHSNAAIFGLGLLGLVLIGTAWIGPVWILSESFYLLKLLFSKMKGGNSGRRELTR